MYPHRQEYEMTEEDLQILLDASKPVPYMVVGGVEPSSPRDNANRASEKLGEKMGFDYTTARPVHGKGKLFFSAIPLETEHAKQERLDRTANMINPCPVCGAEDECPHTPVRCIHEWRYDGPPPTRECIHCGHYQKQATVWNVDDKTKSS